tara:strand:- start:12277 stop:12462 length:186 start_codon:yes stop_codon:yes gene_type:complete
MIDFIQSNFLELLIAVMALIKVVVNLTPTTNDNKVFAWIDKIIDVFIPNYNKKGKKHKNCC